ncbi:hypothetical protein [Natronosalvus caseinilyticus]|uniref:hypothetical protein n=1 Tax=Natronosalvus caseinilyticus TaxID=2953747 RepID=UPI0028AB3B0C|nr:hypothetical protein [Natronosalvus caseinilyticus]
MLETPLHRCLGIMVLTVGLVGLFVLGGAGWSVDAAVASDSSGADEVVLFADVNFDFGANYRDVTTTVVDQDTASERVTTAGVVDSSGIAAALIAPADRNLDVRIGGLLYVHAISIVGAAVVAGRALVGWRIDIRGVALVPKEPLPVDPTHGTNRQAPLMTDGGTQRGE